MGRRIRRREWTQMGGGGRQVSRQSEWCIPLLEDGANRVRQCRWHTGCLTTGRTHPHMTGAKSLQRQVASALMMATSRSVTAVEGGRTSSTKKYYGNMGWITAT